MGLKEVVQNWLGFETIWGELSELNDRVKDLEEDPGQSVPWVAKLIHAVDAYVVVVGGGDQHKAFKLGSGGHYKHEVVGFRLGKIAIVTGLLRMGDNGDMGHGDVYYLRLPQEWKPNIFAGPYFLNNATFYKDNLSVGKKTWPMDAMLGMEGGDVGVRFRFRPQEDSDPGRKGEFRPGDPANWRPGDWLHFELVYATEN